MTIKAIRAPDAGKAVHAGDTGFMEGEVYLADGTYFADGTIDASGGTSGTYTKPEAVAKAVRNEAAAKAVRE
ncbi:MAG: hypothetical protein HY890_07965 [Deltaproteobacteria bacterium]|nr:hypothetical protein [Deltaproteobacteria bacterium]